MSATNSLSARASTDKENPRYDNYCKKMQKLDPFVKIGIEESIITTLILPQIESAKDGVKLLGAYVEKYGASEGNGILFNDSNEVWYMEIGSGHHWIGVKIPDDKYITVANGMRIHNVDLNNEDVLHSKGIFKFVADNGFLEKPKKKSFNFAQAFGILGDPYNDDRIWLAQSLLTPSKIQKPPKIQDRQKVTGKQTKEQYPLFLKADKEIEVQDIMNVLRANYKGTSIEKTAKRPIGVYRTGESHIITFDSTMPQNIQGIIWQAVSTPLGVPYMPLYSSMNEVPPNYAIGNDEYNPLSAFWSFRGLFALGEFDKNYHNQIQKYWKSYEKELLCEKKFIDKTIKKMSKKNCTENKAAMEFAKNYSIGITYNAIALANKKRNKLMTDLTLNQGYKEQVKSMK